MKKLIASVAFVAAAAACSSSTHAVTTSVGPAPTGNQTGGTDPTSALRGFLAAAKQQDLQGMGALFGDKDGSARDRIAREDLEKREIIMATCLRHDRYDIIGDAPGTGGTRTMAVNLTKGDKSAAVNFELVPANDRRWYVQSFDLPKLMSDYCKKG